MKRISQRAYNLYKNLWNKKLSCWRDTKESSRRYYYFDNNRKRIKAPKDIIKEFQNLGMMYECRGLDKNWIKFGLFRIDIREFIIVSDSSSTLSFGKYKGMSIKDVLDIDPSYLVWAHDNIDWFEMEKFLYDKAKKKAVEFKPVWYVNDYTYWDDEDSHWLTYGSSIWD